MYCSDDEAGLKEAPLLHGGSQRPDGTSAYAARAGSNPQKYSQAQKVGVSMETQSRYEDIRNIVLGKLVDHTIDTPYEELSERLFGEGNAFSESETRKRMYGMKAIIDVIDAEGYDNIRKTDKMAELDAKMIELRSERQKFYDQRAAFTKAVRDRSRQEELNEILNEAVRNAELPDLQYEPHDIWASDTDLLVSLNDIHYGAVNDNYWNQYDPDICKLMFENYLNQIIEIGKIHKSENCIVWANGDLISGNIHYSIAVTNKESVVGQLVGVSELIANFLSELSKHFVTVKFVTVAGNHSRINPNKDMALIDERLDDLVEWYLKARMAQFDNVQIGACMRIDPTMYIMDVRGKKYVGVHGDYDKGDSKIHAIQNMAGGDVYAILSGHLHHNAIDSVHGVKTVMGGSFLGIDDFCIQRRILGRPEQLVCVVDSSGIRCYYDVAL